MSSVVQSLAMLEGSNVLSGTVTQHSMLEGIHVLSGIAAHKLTLCLLVFYQLDTNLERVKPGKKDPLLENLPHQIARGQGCRALSGLN